MPDDERPCKRGHVGQRRASGKGDCMACDRERCARRRAEVKAGTYAPQSQPASGSDKFPCGHPRSTENMTPRRDCRECVRARAAAAHQRRLTSAGREKNVYDPDKFPCGHPRIAGNINSGDDCRVCHIERAAKFYRENPGPRKVNEAARRERIQAYRQCRREERADPETMDYLRIIREDPCSYCGGPGGTRDHIIPIVAGGANHWGNYTGACAACNVGKNDKPLLLHLLDRMVLGKIRNGEAT